MRVAGFSLKESGGPGSFLGGPMPRCYVVPGILGSSMVTTESGFPKLWVNVERLAFGEFDRLLLAPDGISPQPPRGKTCLAREPIVEFYGSLTEALEEGLEPHGYDVKPWGYDWRMNITGPGYALAAEIEFIVPANDPCAIVAHSQGGLVARAAWYALKKIGKEGLIRRIVTIGTPHRGSYAPALVWSLQEELIDGLMIAMDAVQLVYGTFGPSPIDHIWSAYEVAAVTGTWPAMYDLLPLCDQAGLGADPLREELFDVDNWPAKLSLSGSHFWSSKQTWQSLLKDPDSMPPDEVLTTIAGITVPTPYKLAAADELGNPQAFQFGILGDGRVTEESALVPSPKRLTLAASHAGLLEDPWLLARIADEVLEVRVPPVPPAPIIASPFVNPSFGRGPPLKLTQNVRKH